MTRRAPKTASRPASTSSTAAGTTSSCSTKAPAGNGRPARSLLPAAVCSALRALLRVLQMDGNGLHCGGQRDGAGRLVNGPGGGGGDVADERGQLEQHVAGRLLAGQGERDRGAAGADGQPEVPAAGGREVGQADDVAAAHPRVGDAAADDQGTVGA